MQHPLRGVVHDGLGAQPGITVAFSAVLAPRHRRESLEESPSVQLLAETSS